MTFPDDNRMILRHALGVALLGTHCSIRCLIKTRLTAFSIASRTCCPPPVTSCPSLYILVLFLPPPPCCVIIPLFAVPVQCNKVSISAAAFC